MITDPVKTSALSYHAAIIMDGNGRWAKERGRPRFWGHVRGAAVASKIIEEAVNLNLKAITLFSFSTENWSRPEIEIKVLFKLLGKFILKEKKRALDKKIKFRVIGDLTGLPAETVKVIRDMEGMTRDFEGVFDKVWGSGFYKAKVIVSYGQSGQVVIQKFSFYLLPIRLILAVLVVLLVIISVYIVTRRHIKHRKDDQNRRIKELEQEVAEMKNSTLEKYDN